MSWARQLALLVLAVLVVGCAASSSPSSSAADRSGITSAGRMLTIAERLEPTALSDLLILVSRPGLFVVPALFNANLSVIDDHDGEHPLLAEELPQVGTPSWVLYPDGTMETTYHLRPNLTWHDGVPLTADDWVFALQVYKTPDFALATTSPFKQIADVTAADDRTVVIHWSTTYPDAGTLLRGGSFPALPRHILDEDFQQDASTTFANEPYWTREFVGVGPYKLDRWEPGAFIETVAFDGYAMGRPKIDRIKIVFIGDANTAMNNLLSGDVQVTAVNVIALTQVQILKERWGSSNDGRMILTNSQYRALRFQFNSAYANPAATLDLRVRRAMAYALDRQTLVDTLFGGTEIVADSFVVPTSVFGPATDKAIMKYPYDPQRSQQLMAEASYTRDADGFYVSNGTRLSPEVRVNASADNEAEQSAIADAWRRNGFDMQETTNSLQAQQDPAVRISFHNLFLASSPIVSYAPLDFRLSNSWTDPDYNSLSAEYLVTLDQQTRINQMAQMAKIFTEDAAAVSFRFQSHVWAVSNAVSGFQVGTAETPSLLYNMQNWELK